MLLPRPTNPISSRTRRRKSWVVNAATLPGAIRRSRKINSNKKGLESGGPLPGASGQRSETGSVWRDARAVSSGTRARATRALSSVIERLNEARQEHYRRRPPPPPTPTPVCPCVDRRTRIQFRRARGAERQVDPSKKTGLFCCSPLVASTLRPFVGRSRRFRFRIMSCLVVSRERETIRATYGSQSPRCVSPGKRATLTSPTSRRSGTFFLVFSFSCFFVFSFSRSPPVNRRRTFSKRPGAKINRWHGARTKFPPLTDVANSRGRKRALEQSIKRSGLETG